LAEEELNDAKAEFKRLAALSNAALEKCKVF